MTTISTHIRRNALAYLALFVALPGTAFAAATVGSEEVIDNSLRSVDVRNNEIRSTDVRNDDLAGGGLAAADVQNGSLTGVEIEDDSLTSDDVDESTFDEPGFGSAQHALCDPVSQAFITCGSINVGPLVPSEANFLLATAMSWYTNAGGGAGTCELRVRGASLPLTTRRVGELNNTTDSTHPNSAALIEAGQLGAPNATIDLRCNETESDIVFTNVEIGLAKMD